ncbi:Zinc finger CCCH domain-containing protein 17 [Hondaea fermentalgiana]|uniref:Zinc finger CCCH domain-containing protein 17 n=1 Tax=Hondaea fermentalgiana TaxID=2315210 RepID=A0A2R5GBJ4_9STRA|nr:Zinc finger CCCH domain-containing protein 17 [Hondaea fermentalgiana]|eukprot:GBG28356.1 Zinc finger CCCH domain-containing protein 17 [Hondaea fermentalgiana]
MNFGGGNHSGNSSRGGGGGRGRGRGGSNANYNNNNNNNSGGRGGRGRRGNSRGGGRGTSGRGRGTRIKFADSIATFDVSVDAHVMPGKPGIQALTLWAENNILFSGGADGITKMFDINSGTCNESPDGKEVSSLCFELGWLFVGYLDQPQPGQDVGFVKGYNLMASPVEIFNFELNAQFPAAHQGRVTSICVAGEFVFTASEDKTVRAWKLDQKWNLVGSLGNQFAHDTPVRKVAAWNNKIFTGAFNGEIKIWSVQGAQESVFQAHSEMVTDICGWTGPNQNVLLTCSADKTIKVWDLAANQGLIAPNSQPVFTYPPPDSPLRPKALTCMKTHQLGSGVSILICGFLDGSAQVLDLPDFTDLGFLNGHDRNSTVTSLQVVPQQNLLFLGSLSGKLSCYKFVS